MSFTAGIATGDQWALRLAHGLAGLADGLGLDTVAEGIESQVQADALARQDWLLGQGFHFGRPTPSPGPDETRDRAAQPVP